MYVHVGLTAQTLVGCPVFKSYNYRCVSVDEWLMISRCQSSHSSGEDMIFLPHRVEPRINEVEPIEYKGKTEKVILTFPRKLNSHLSFLSKNILNFFLWCLKIPELTNISSLLAFIHSFIQFLFSSDNKTPLMLVSPLPSPQRRKCQHSSVCLTPHACFCSGRPQHLPLWLQSLCEKSQVCNAVVNLHILMSWGVKGKQPMASFVSAPKESHGGGGAYQDGRYCSFPKCVSRPQWNIFQCSFLQGWVPKLYDFFTQSKVYLNILTQKYFGITGERTTRYNTVDTIHSWMRELWCWPPLQSPDSRRPAPPWGAAHACKPCSPTWGGSLKHRPGNQAEGGQPLAGDRVTSRLCLLLLLFCLLWIPNFAHFF